MVKTNEHIIDKQCLRNNGNVLTVPEKNTKSNLENLARDAFECRVCSWNKKIFPEADLFGDVSCLIGKSMLEGQCYYDEEQKSYRTIKISVRNNKICV